LKFAIHDPDFNLPAIMFANKGGDDQKRSLVGRLMIFQFKIIHFVTQPADSPANITDFFV
jgi:hypothetical protein